MSAPDCSDLRCKNAAGPDGCFHQPEEPYCAEHLRSCSECRVDIDLSHEPFHVQAARHFARTHAHLLIHGSPDQPLSDAVEPVPYEPYASDGIEADHAADEEWAGPLRQGNVA